jgi:type I restriction enzyme R subunit
VFRYDVEQAILDGFLVDYEAVAIKSDVRMNGAFLKEGEEVGYIDTKTGKEQRDELEDERQFPSEDIEKRITAPQSNRKIIEEIATVRLRPRKGDRPFPQNPHLRRQRHRAHLARRSTGENLPRSVRPGR